MFYNHSRRLRDVLASSAAFAAIACSGLAQAQESGRARVEVQAQSLSSALREIARQTHRDILFSAEAVNNRRNVAVSGQMTAREAVERAIAGQGLELVEQANGDLVVRARSAESFRSQAAPDQAVSALDDIVVTAPIRDSVARALLVQRNSDNVVSVIAADTIGRFPDQTAAAALARLPGVGVQRDQGQERYIQVRGAPTRWTTTAFNGVNVLGGDDRIFRFDSVPSTLIEEVVLNKTLTPSMSAESLAGQVDIHTVQPLRRQGLHGALEGGLGQLDMGDGDQVLYGGRVGWSNDRLGFVVSGSHYEFQQEADNAEPRYDATGVSQLRVAKYITLRETSALSGTVAFRPAEGHTLSLTSLYTEFNDHEQRNQYTFYPSGGTGTRDFQTGELASVEVRGLFNDGGALNSTFYNVLHGDHQIGAWNATWDLAYTRSEVTSGSPLIEQRQSPGLRSSMTYVMGEGGIPFVTLYDTDRTGATPTLGARRTNLDQLAFDQETITWSGSERTTTDYALKADVRRDWSGFGGFSTFAAGLQFNDREYVDVGSYANVTPSGAVGATISARSLAAALGVEWTPLDLVLNRAVDERFDRGFTFNYVDNHAMRAQAEALLDAARAANAAGADYAVPALIPSQTFSVKERLTAAYIQNTWRRGPHTILAGLRAENVEVESSGFATVNGTTTPLSLSSDDLKLFPSLHWNMDATDELKIRAAFVTGSARPNFSQQSANTTISDLNQTVSGGNPSLKSESAMGFDGSVEWYFAPSALLSAGVFYRDVKDVLFSSTRVVGDDRYDLAGIDRSGYDYSTTVNGDDGELYGLELTYLQPFTFLPGPLSGLGVEASLTLLDGEFTTPGVDGAAGRVVGFPGTSDRLSSLSVFFEKYGLSARVSYQHRTGWLDEVGATPASDMYWDDSERVDLSLRYQATQTVTLFVDANNLSDQRGRRYQGSSDRTYELEGFGRRFMAGLRATF
ncbi:TonB-dependent receptor [Brevundimonas sp.]|jgi:TonB-dependent receptor|uniref:TonB-dependent receptor n=1 Tax=Brevundimonas sp. TaxID=1871086 RepID=UPI0037BEBEC0